MSDGQVTALSIAAGAGFLVLVWTLIYVATGRFYPFGLLISIGVALLVGMRLRERYARPRRD